MPGFAGSHEGYPRGGWENKMNQERLFVFVCETWCIEGKERSLRLLFSLVSLIMLQTDVVLVLCMSCAHTKSHSLTHRGDSNEWYNDTTMDLEIIPHLLNQMWCRRKLLLRIVKLISFLFFCAKCFGNHAFVLKCASVKLFSHTSCLYVSYFVVICVSNLVSAGLHGGCLSCSPSCPNMVLCWL